MNSDSNPESTAPDPEQQTATPDPSDSKSNGTSLVIVESPAKARTIAQYLGTGYVVESSVGHVRDLPSSATEIPARYKPEPWAKIGVNVDDDFDPLYIVPSDKKKTVSRLKKLLTKASTLYLATDEDREGEAIAWHLAEVLAPKVPVRRMVFHEITRSAIEEALEHPRSIDQGLVKAQETRRILDRLYGYEVSPVLWKKVQPRLSAGRVQSAALRLVVDRERRRMDFVAAGYWDVEAVLQSDSDPPTVGTRLVELGNQRVATGRDFDAETGALKTDTEAILIDQVMAEAIAAQVGTNSFIVEELTERPYSQRPPAPFITSTLQQEAGRKLRFTAQRTMQAAQSLYENGYITYMRTDSTDLSDQAVNAARAQVRSLYGDEYLPGNGSRHQATQVRGAQEAHEAIRPAGETFRTPQEVTGDLEGDRFRLYELIWQRTVASQMKDATGLRTAVKLNADTSDYGIAIFSASGKVITFPGFLRAYVEGSDDPDAEIEDQERLLPPLELAQELTPATVDARGHETQPPARFTEASLVKELEEQGIGRPSTYASIIQTILDRDYAGRRGSALVPTFVAFAVVQLLERHFRELVSSDFTARMEDSLDSIAVGELGSTPWLREFYFGGGTGAVNEDTQQIGLRARIAEGWEAIDARAVSSIPLGNDASGQTIAVRVGRFGPYLQCGEEGQRASLADDVAPDEVTLEYALNVLEEASRGDQIIGDDPTSGNQIVLKSGRFGPYVEVSTDGDEDNVRRASLWVGMTMESLTIEEALLALSFPKTLGEHPESKTPITAQDGPNGPYLRMGEDTRSLRDHEHLGSITLTDAVTLFAEPKQRGRRSGPVEISALGEHPDNGVAIRILKGRYGPYVTDGTVNASIPKERDPASVNLQEAIDLIEAREQKLRDEGKDPRAPKTKRGGRRNRSKAKRGT